MNFFTRIFWPFRLYMNHIESLLDGFDPLIDGLTLPSTFPDEDHFHFKYFIPFVVSMSVVLDNIRQIVMNDFNIEHIKDLFHRTVFFYWPSYWEQVDAIVSAGYVMLPSTFLTLTISHFGHRVTFLYRSNQQDTQLQTYTGQLISRTLSEKLWAFRTKMNPHMAASKYSMLTNLNLVFSGNFIFNFILRPTYTIRMVTTLVVCPLYFTYVGINLTIGNYFFLTCKYIQIKQEHQLGNFGKLIAKLDQGHVTQRLWVLYNETFRHCLDIISEIRKMNAFWRALNTIVIGVYIFEICYISMMQVMAKSLQDRIQMSPLTLIAFLHFVFVYVVTGVASKLIVNNTMLFKSMRRFHTRYHIHTVKTHNPTHVSRHLRMNVTNEFFSDYMRKGCFKLLNGYTINHRLFEVLISYIIFTSLKLFGKQLAEALAVT